MHSEQMYTFGPAIILSTSRWGLWQKEQARPDGFEYLDIYFCSSGALFKIAGGVWTRQEPFAVNAGCV